MVQSSDASVPRSHMVGSPNSLGSSKHRASKKLDLETGGAYSDTEFDELEESPKEGFAVKTAI